MLRFLLAGLLLLQLSCTTTRPAASSTGSAAPAAVASASAAAVPGAPAWVYKTKKDYTDYVPVLLSADKSRVVSYPAPSDLTDGSSYLKPLPLKAGYLLDRKGIGPDVAFLKLTYEEYASLPKAPSRAELLHLIQDADPLSELCNCGSRRSYEDIAAQLNQLIEAGTLREQCKVVK